MRLDHGSGARVGTANRQAPVGLHRKPLGTRPFELRSQLEQQVLRQKLPYSWVPIGNPSARPALRWPADRSSVAGIV